MGDEQFMRMAIKEMAKCQSQDGDGKPKVGAVVVRGDQVLASAHRGEIEPGQHAEFIALDIKLKDQALNGTTVYTTLEPCTNRSPDKTPCAERLVSARVARVVIGQVDPNPIITGKGILRLREAGIEIGFFTMELADQVESLNREFSRQQKKQHLMSPASYIIDGKTRLLIHNQLLEDWKNVAIALEIPPSDRRRFPAGEECFAILDWLEARRRLKDLAYALKLVGRDDLAGVLP